MVHRLVVSCGTSEDPPAIDPVADLDCKPEQARGQTLASPGGRDLTDVVVTQRVTIAQVDVRTVSAR